MESYAVLARDNLLIGAVAFAIIMTVAYSTFRVIKQREKNRRVAAWRAMRAEQDRIWNERMGIK